MSKWPQTVLVTGSTGLVGSALIAALLPHCRVRSLNRSNPNLADVAHTDAAFGDNVLWLDNTEYLQGVDVVVHCAARVHLMQDTATDPLAQYCKVNTDATLALAEAAAKAGVKRFIFLSTIKVNGEFTAVGQAFSAADPVKPTDPYAVSKWRAEQALLALSQQSGMQVVIIRPPLVYGPGVKANFLNLFNAVAKGIPLPFGAIDNKRSMVSVDNLVSLICTCLTHENAAGKVFLVSDGQDISSAELVRLMAKAQQVPARLLPIPLWLMRTAASVLGKAAQYQRVVASLQLDISATCQTLDWQPQQTPQQAMELLVKKRASGC